MLEIIKRQTNMKNPPQINEQNKDDEQKQKK